jgi:HAD superfamily hydrolase (TIGR01509 family)
MPAPGLLIFDCDGVLIDSEIIVARVLAERLSGAGFQATPAEALELGWGKSSTALSAAIMERYGKPVPDGFVEETRAEIGRAYARDLQPIAGIVDLLSASEVPRCVASNSHIDRIRLKLSITALNRFFEPHLFSASMVTQGKPAPDLLHLAAARFGATPDQCVVIEDSISGVMAARAAGMSVLGFVGGSHCPAGHADRLRSIGCVQVATTMAEIDGYLRA